jgi:hypothetical protein
MPETDIITTKFVADLTGIEQGVNDYAKTLNKAVAADDKLEASQKNLAGSTGSLASKFDTVKKSADITARATKNLGTEVQATATKSGLMSKLGQAFDKVKAGAASAVNSTKGFFSSLTSGLQSAVPSVGGLGGALSGLTGPIGLAAGAVAFLVSNLTRLDSAKVFVDGVKIAFDGLLNRLTSFEGIGSIISGKGIQEDAIQGAAFAKILDQIEEKQRTINIANSEAAKKVASLNQTIRDRTKSEQERIAASDAISAIEEKRGAADIALARDKLGFAQLQIDAAKRQGISEENLSDDLLNARADALANLRTTEAASIQILETNERRKNAIVEGGESERTSAAAKGAANREKIDPAAEQKAQAIAAAEKQITDILQGVSRERENITLTDAQKEVAAIERKYEDIAQKTREGFAKIKEATPVAEQAAVDARADGAQVQIKAAQDAELVALGQKTLEKLQADQDAADALLLQRKQKLSDDRLALLIADQQKEVEAATAGGEDLTAIYERQAQERLALIQASEEAQLSALIADFEKEAAILEQQGLSTLALTAQFEDELSALKDGFRKQNLTKEEEEARKVQEIRKAAQQANLALAAEGFTLLQEFSDASFDKRIANIDDQTAILQEKLTKATTDTERASVEAQIAAADKQKAALEEQKKSTQGFAIAAALINTYLAAQLAYTSQLVPGDPSSLIRAIVAAGLATAAGLLNVAKIKGFEEGGHTAKNPSNKKAVGVVHANEWVAPAWMVKDPQYANTIKWLEASRKGRRASKVAGYAIGGIGQRVTSESQCLAQGGQWINGACTFPQGVRGGTNYTFTKGRGISQSDASAQCAASGGVFINGACVRPGDIPGFLAGGMVSQTFAAPELRAMNDVLSHRVEARTNHFVHGTDLGQRVSSSVMLAKFYDKNIVERADQTNKVLKEGNKLLSELVKGNRPRSKRAR